MTHDYSVQIHNWITQKLKQVKLERVSAEKANDKEKEEYLTGQLEELLSLRKCLSEQIDLETQTYYK